MHGHLKKQIHANTRLGVFSKKNKYMASDLGTIISYSEMHRTLFSGKSKLLPFASFFSLEINGQKDTRDEAYWWSSRFFSGVTSWAPFFSSC
jgi:hypothetical protein